MQNAISNEENVDLLKFCILNQSNQAPQLAYNDYSGIGGQSRTEFASEQVSSRYSSFAVINVGQ